MKLVRCYACKKLGHIAKECKNKVRTPHQKEKTSSHLKIWKKKEVQSGRCGTAPYTDITNSRGAESVKIQSHTQVAYIRELDTTQSRICQSEEK